jgi:hypothetical protein
MNPSRKAEPKREMIRKELKMKKILATAAVLMTATSGAFAGGLLDNVDTITGELMKQHTAQDAAVSGDRNGVDYTATSAIGGEDYTKKPLGHTFRD